MAPRFFRKDTQGRTVTQRIQAERVTDARSALFAVHAVHRLYEHPSFRGIVTRVEIERMTITAVVAVPDDTPDVDAWALELREELRRMLAEIGRDEWKGRLAPIGVVP